MRTINRNESALPGIQLTRLMLGGIFVAEKMSEVFEMYDVRLDHIGRGRGAMLLQTDKGVRQIRATTAGEKRLQAEYDFKEHMYLAGFPHIDRLVKMWRMN